jgi:exopolysaccharide biosynthesis polyprenyl glycosylphosphotransferase
MEATTIGIRRLGALRRWRVRPATLLVGADVFMLTIASALSVLIEPAHAGLPYAWAAAYALTCLVVLRIRGFYEFRLGASIVAEVGRIIAATALAAMLVICARAFVSDGTHVALLGARLWVYSAVFLAAGRAGFAMEARRLWTHALAVRPTLVLGAGNVGRLIARRLRDRPELGLRPVGHIDDEPRPGSDDDLPLLGGTRDLEDVITANQVSHVIITFSLAPDAEMRDLMRRCKELGTQVLVVPRLYEEMTHRLTIEHLGAIPLIRVEQPDPRGWQFMIKYSLDRVAAACLLIALAPLLTAIAVLVRLSSTGPVLFRQKRVGLDGRAFTMFKFRSMRGQPDETGEADAKWAAVIRGERPDQAPELADRTTGVGRILRATSLDELPQLFNVLRGDMSLVGPRPERVGYARDFESLVYRYGDRYRVKSGITGWAQVQKLRGETSLSDRVEWDNFYIENWSLWLDLKILLMTFPAALRGGLMRDSEPAEKTEQRTGSSAR